MEAFAIQNIPEHSRHDMASVFAMTLFFRLHRPLRSLPA